MYLKGIAAVLAAGFLTACADDIAGTQGGKQQLQVEQADDQVVTGTEASISPFHWDPTLYAGILGARIVIPQEDGRVLVAELIDGKERGGAEVKLPLGPDGPVLSFNSTDSKAFTGQEVRGAVERALFEQTGQTIREVTPELRGVIEAAIEGLCAVAGVATCAAGALGGEGE